MYGSFVSLWLYVRAVLAVAAAVGGCFDCLLLQGPIFLFVFLALAACIHGCCCLGWLVALCVV